MVMLTITPYSIVAEKLKEMEEALKTEVGPSAEEAIKSFERSRRRYNLNLSSPAVKAKS